MVALVTVPPLGFRNIGISKNTDNRRYDAYPIPGWKSPEFTPNERFRQRNCGCIIDVSRCIWGVLTWIALQAMGRLFGCYTRVPVSAGRAFSGGGRSSLGLGRYLGFIVGFFLAKTDWSCALLEKFLVVIGKVYMDSRSFHIVSRSFPQQGSF